MGKLATMLKGTKELRKQFTKPKVVKLTAKNKKIQDMIYPKEHEGFGCNATAVAKLISAIVGQDLSLAESKTRFTVNDNAMLVVIRDSNYTKGEVIEAQIRHGGSESFVDGTGVSRNAYRDEYRPATDVEIKKYFA